MNREDVLPIDKGWAWIVVLASAGMFAMAAGGVKTQGVILVEILERFDGVYSPSTLLWVFTSVFIIGCLFSPVISLIIVKLSYRAAALIGVTAIALSHVGLAYAFDFPTLLIFFSLPAGVGFDTVIIASLLVSAPYFKKRRGLAISLIASGSGLGTLSIPHILRFLFKKMDFAGAMLLYAGFVLQFLCLASLLRPMSYYEQMYADQLSALPPNDVTLLEETEIETNDETTKHSTSLLEPQIRERSVSVHHRPQHSTGEDLKISEDKPYHSASKLDIKPADTKHCDLRVHSTALDRTHLVSLGEFSGSIFFMETNDEEKPSGGNERAGESKQIFDWRVMLMPKFVMVCVSIVVYTLANAVVYTCVPALAEEAGVSKEMAALSITLAGSIEIPCRILNGVIADREIMSATAQYSGCIFIAGLISLLCPMIYGLPGVMLGLLGMSTTGISVFNLLPLVIAELIGQEHVTSGMGIQNTCQAVPLFASSYITGVIYDSTGSWRIVFFYIAASLIAASAVIWPYLIIMCRKRKATHTERENS